MRFFLHITKKLQILNILSRKVGRNSLKMQEFAKYEAKMLQKNVKNEEKIIYVKHHENSKSS